MYIFSFMCIHVLVFEKEKNIDDIYFAIIE